MASILPIHARMAELWTIRKARELTESEKYEMEHCLESNANYAWNMIKLENLSLVAFEVDDITWQHDICYQIEQIKITGK